MKSTCINQSLSHLTYNTVISDIGKSVFSDQALKSESIVIRKEHFILSWKLSVFVRHMFVIFLVIKAGTAEILRKLSVLKPE